MGCSDNKESIIKIWHSEVFNKIRGSLMKGNRTISPLCSKCVYNGYKIKFNPNAEYKSTFSSDNICVFERLLEKVDYGIDKFL